MKPLVACLASTRLTLLGIGALGLILIAGEFAIFSAPGAVLAILAGLTLNLAAALIMTPRLRQEPGLLIFHIALLVLLILAGVGRLTHFDGHVEVMEGSAFSASEVTPDSKGWLHPDWLQGVAFVQGPFSVDYAPGVKRARTRSEILVDAKSATETRSVGDDVPLVERGYRFYTTHNKGIAVVLTWLPIRGEAITGAVHMPAYPAFDWKQDNAWQPPNGPEVRFWLHLDTPLKEDSAWTLASEKVSGMLVVNSQGKRVELKRGESVAVDGGALRFDELRGWMGYRIFFDPTLPWLLAAAMIAVFGLALQFWRKSMPRTAGATAVAPLLTKRAQ
jgi:cytochrome c biogenesis protein ResB